MRVLIVVWESVVRWFFERAPVSDEVPDVGWRLGWGGVLRVGRGTVGWCSNFAVENDLGLL